MKNFFWILSIFFCAFFTFSAQADALRVISLYPGHTDNIAALGGEGMIAASYNDDLESLAGLPRLAARAAPEAILAHRPDIVLMRSLNERASPDAVSVLERAGVRVHVIEPPTWDEFEDYLVQIADIAGLDPTDALARLARIKNDTERTVRPLGKNGKQPRVFLEATSREIHTCAPGSWAARVIELCGGENAAREAHPLRPGSPLAAWGVERAVSLSDSLDIYLLQQGAMNASNERDVRARPWFAAFGSDVKLAFVPERFLSRPSLVGLERGVDALLPIFYGTH